MRFRILIIVLMTGLPSFCRAQFQNSSALYPTLANAQFVAAPSRKDSLPAEEGKNKVWLMGSLSGSLYLNRIDTAYIQDFGDWGYSLKFGAVWHHRVLQFDYHSETEGVFPLFPPEHRYDYALLYGISSRSESVFANVMVGISLLDYLRRGNQLTPPSSPNAGDATYQQLSGDAVGLAASAEFYLTPIRYWGLFGMGLYGCLNSRLSYLVLELSVLELNVPITPQ